MKVSISKLSLNFASVACVIVLTATAAESSSNWFCHSSCAYGQVDSDIQLPRPLLSLGAVGGETISSPISIDEPVLLSANVSNDNANQQSFITLFEIEDSSGVTTFIDSRAGIIQTKTETLVTASWKPEQTGEYLLKSFLITDSGTPRILSPVSSMYVSSMKLAPNNSTEVVSSENPANQLERNRDLAQLRVEALVAINKDREAFGLPDVSLSLNPAAQIHAEDAFETKRISHWMTNGEKPYMTYSKYGGDGFVAQNIAISGYDKQSYQKCLGEVFSCDSIDPAKAIRTTEYAMVYNDEDEGNGHRDNILDKIHTKVSIGIAYDRYFFVIVQNFENTYLKLQSQIDDDFGSRTQILAVIAGSGQDPELSLSDVGIYYDPLPTASDYLNNKDSHYYGLGKFIAAVVRPLEPGYSYEQPTDRILVIADNWQKTGSSIFINFSDSAYMAKPGVYTIILQFDDGQNKIPVLIHSFFRY